MRNLVLLGTGADAAGRFKSTEPEALVDEILQDPGFSGTLMPELLLGFYGIRGSSNFWPTLKSMKTPRGQLYYLGKPCTEGQALSVQPWWDIGSEVLVCPDSYRVDVFNRADSPQRSCDSLPLADFETSGRCGCGANLFRCVPSAAVGDQIRADLRDELSSTLRYIIDNDLPASAIFTESSTYRRRGAEYVYRQWLVEAMKLQDARAVFADLAQWPEEGKWAKRNGVNDDQWAGVLTTPQIVHFFEDRRQRQWVIFDLLWCAGAQSAGASPDDVLAIGKGSQQSLKERSSFQGENAGWDELAHRKICTDCHARMDYGFQFFLGYPDPRVHAMHFVPALHKPRENGPIYHRDIGDSRGEYPLTPKGFALAAVEQPEFRQCLAEKIGTHLVGTELDASLTQSLAAVLDSDRPTLKALMKTGLLHLASSERSGQGGKQALAEARSFVAPTSSSSSASPVALSGETRSLLDEYCTDCHFDGESSQASLELEQLPRKHALLALDQVYGGRMPKSRVLDEATRERLIRTLVKDIWGSEHAEAALAAYVLHAPSRAHRWSTIERMIRVEGGADSKGINAVENALPGDRLFLNQTLGIMIGIEAAKACSTEANREECLDRSLDLESFAMEQP